jgi:RNA polymerase sigma factor (sigma-70 family)
MTVPNSSLSMPGDARSPRTELRLIAHRGRPAAGATSTASPVVDASLAAATSAVTALYRDRELLERWRDGDRDAGAALLDHYVGYVRRIAGRLGVRAADFEEFWQELVLRTLQQLPTLPQRLRTSFAGYIAWQTRDLVRQWRRKHRTALAAPELPTSRIDEPGVRTAFWEALAECSQRLPPREQEVFGLRFLDGLDLAEVALRTGSNANAVAQAVFRLVRRLRDGLARKGFAGPGDLA